MFTTKTTDRASPLAGFLVAVFCSGVWLGSGLFLFALQGGVA